jgi:hypothetical protein
MIFYFFKNFIDDLYNINFQFNGEFCKIRICYLNIHNLCYSNILHHKRLEGVLHHILGLFNSIMIKFIELMIETIA